MVKTEPKTRLKEGAASEPITIRRRLAIAWRRLRTFLRTERQVWAAPGVIVAAILASYFPAQTLEQQITYAGAILQVLGLATVALGLHESRKLFELPSLWSKLRQVIAKPKGVTVELEGAAGSYTMALAPSVTTGMSKDATLEQRLAEMERRLDEAEERLRSLAKEFESRASKLREELQTERSERKRDVNALDKKIKTAAVGGIRLEQTGLVWLFFGVVFATVPGAVVWATGPVRLWLGLG